MEVSINDGGYSLPVYGEGVVVSGFGRGSAELGIPTANLNEEAVGEISKNLQTGIYSGYVGLLKKEKKEIEGVFPVALSCGWNPFYGNKQKSIEFHVVQVPEHHKEAIGNLLGRAVAIAITRYIRPERNYTDIFQLKNAIRGDINETLLRQTAVEAGKSIPIETFFRLQ